MTNIERAMQIWPLLVHAAERKQILFYGDVARYIGLRGAGVLGQMLGPIMHYCQQHELPPLTVLVVNQDDGVPGEGFTAAGDVPAAQARVFRHDWRRVACPGAQDRAAAVRGVGPEPEEGGTDD